MENRLLPLAFLILLSTYSTMASNYRIHRIFGKGQIVISNKSVHEGMSFDEKAKIRCTTNNVGMTVIDDQGKFFDFYGKIAYPKEMTLEEHENLFREYERGKLHNRIGMMTKGMTDERKYLYLLYDSLTIRELQARKETQFEATWKIGEDTFHAIIPASEDKSELYISRYLFACNEKQIIELEIWAIDYFGKYQITTIWIELLNL